MVKTYVLKNGLEIYTFYSDAHPICWSVPEMRQHKTLSWPKLHNVGRFFVVLKLVRRHTAALVPVTPVRTFRVVDDSTVSKDQGYIQDIQADSRVIPTSILTSIERHQNSVDDASDVTASLNMMPKRRSNQTAKQPKTKNLPFKSCTIRLHRHLDGNKYAYSSVRTHVIDMM